MVGIKQIVIPRSVTEIGKAAFCDCAKLTKVEIAPDSQLMKIDNYAFADCPLL